MNYIDSLKNILKNIPLANITISDIHKDVLILKTACEKAEKYDKKEKETQKPAKGQLNGVQIQSLILDEVENL